MPKYAFFVRNKRNRIRYPKNFYLADAKAARQVALRIAWAFGEVVPGWSDLSPEQQKNFIVEVVDEAGQAVLSISFNDAE